MQLNCEVDEKVAAVEPEVCLNMAGGSEWEVRESKARSKRDSPWVRLREEKAVEVEVGVDIVEGEDERGLVAVQHERNDEFSRVYV
jgi:hypothetical protein